MTNLLELKDKAQRYLAEVVPVEIDRDGDLVIRGESTAVFIRCAHLGDQSDEGGPSVVRIFAPILQDVAPTPELFEFVATHSDDWIFGHLWVHLKDGSATIQLAHRLLGDYLDAEEIRWATLAMLNTADKIDDELKSRFGGMRFIEP